MGSNSFQVSKLCIPQIVKRYTEDKVGKGYDHQICKIQNDLKDTVNVIKLRYLDFRFKIY